MSLGFLQSEHWFVIASVPVVVRHRVNFDDDPSAGRRMSWAETFENFWDMIGRPPRVRQS